MKNVAIICGGDSGEFEISVKSAQVVKKNLDSELYDSKIVVVSKKGWYCVLKDGTHLEVDKNDFSISVHGHKMKFDVAFNAVHGEPGENGPLSGYLDLLGIPCTSSPLTTCALLTEISNSPESPPQIIATFFIFFVILSSRIKYGMKVNYVSNKTAHN